MVDQESVKLGRWVKGQHADGGVVRGIFLLILACVDTTGNKQAVDQRRGDAVYSAIKSENLG